VKEMKKMRAGKRKGDARKKEEKRKTRRSRRGVK
jgi:hypothetical protein